MGKDQEGSYDDLGDDDDGENENTTVVLNCERKLFQRNYEYICYLYECATCIPTSTSSSSHALFCFL